MKRRSFIRQTAVVVTASLLAGLMNVEGSQFDITTDEGQEWLLCPSQPNEVCVTDDTGTFRERVSCCHTDCLDFQGLPIECHQYRWSNCNPQSSCNTGVCKADNCNCNFPCSTGGGAPA